MALNFVSYHSFMGNSHAASNPVSKYVYAWDCDRDKYEWLRCHVQPCSVCGKISDDTKAYEHKTTGAQYCSDHAINVVASPADRPPPPDHAINVVASPADRPPPPDHRFIIIGAVIGAVIGGVFAVAGVIVWLEIYRPDLTQVRAIA